MNKLIIIKTEMHNFKNYTYLVVNTRNNNAICIDPAWEIDKYHEKITECDINLVAIYLTHHHLDHSHLADQLAKHYNCPVYMTLEEIEYYKFSCHNLKAISHESDFLFTGDISAKIIRTPGHTFGGACFLIDDILFTGDTLFIEGCGMCSGKGASPELLYQSLQRLLNDLPGDTKVYPGHQFKNPIGCSINFVKQNNLYLNFTNQNDFVKFRMREGQKSNFNFI